MLPVILLLISNTFMTFASYGHLNTVLGLSCKPLSLAG